MKIVCSVKVVFLVIVGMVIVGCISMLDNVILVKGFELNWYFGIWYEIVWYDYSFEEGLSYVIV